VEFSTATTFPYADQPRAILDNVGNFPVTIVVDGAPAEVSPWYVGRTVNAWEGPTYGVVVVGDEPNPYNTDEWSQHEYGARAEEPEPSVVHTLTVWAIDETGPASYLITDEMRISLPATLLGYGALMTVTQDPYLCEVDPPLEPFLESVPTGTERTDMLFAFFDDTGDLEIEAHYPAVLAFTVNEGALTSVPPDSVRCILRLDPENY
jgi:hypothetical protein